MSYQKTNFPGYSKDKKSNVIVPDNLAGRVNQVKVARQRYKENQQLTRDVANLKDRLERLERLLAK